MSSLLAIDFSVNLYLRDSSLTVDYGTPCAGGGVECGILPLPDQLQAATDVILAATRFMMKS